MEKYVYKGKNKEEILESALEELKCFIASHGVVPKSNHNRLSSSITGILWMASRKAKNNGNCISETKHPEKGLNRFKSIRSLWEKWKYKVKQITKMWRIQYYIRRITASFLIIITYFLWNTILFFIRISFILLLILFLKEQKIMKKTPVAKKKSLKAKKQGFLSRSSNILNSRRQKGRKNLANN